MCVFNKCRTVYTPTYSDNKATLTYLHVAVDSHPAYTCS